MSTGLNPLIQQGNLNRVLTSVVLTDFPELNVTSSFMSKALSQLTFDDDANDQIGTATGVVNSPKPYIMATLQINILRSQSLAALYYAQLQAGVVLGSVKVYTDVDPSILPPFALANCSLQHVDPGPFDGQDPTTKVTIKGIYYTNAELWAAV